MGALIMKQLKLILILTLFSSFTSSIFAANGGGNSCGSGPLDDICFCKQGADCRTKMVQCVVNGGNSSGETCLPPPYGYICYVFCDQGEPV